MNFELQILDAIQSLRTTVGDMIIPLISAAGNGGILWILLTGTLLCIRKYRRTGCIMAAALLLDLILCNGLVKNLVGRVRPCDVNTSIELLIARPTDASFPSGHTASSFAAVFALFFAGNKKLAFWMLIPACLIALSRLYLYVHYPTDILGGVLMGLLCGWLGSAAVRQIEHFIKYSGNIRGKQNEN